MSRHIARVTNAYRGVGWQGWAPRQGCAIINIMFPVSVALVACWTVVVFAPAKMSNLGSVDGRTEEEVSKCDSCLVLGLGPRPQVGFDISAVLKSLKERAS